MIRRPIDWMVIYHQTTKHGASDLKFAEFILKELTHYNGGAYSDDDARSLANAMHAYAKCNEPPGALTAAKGIEP